MRTMAVKCGWEKMWVATSTCGVVVPLSIHVCCRLVKAARRVIAERRFVKGVDDIFTFIY